MHRRLVRPFGSSITPARGVSMLIGLAVMVMLYDTARDASTWTWLAPAQDQTAYSSGYENEPTPESPEAEVVISGPNDLIAEERERFSELSPLLRDRTELMRRDMALYWQLMAWARTQKFSELYQRSRSEPNFSELWEAPDEFRGAPIRLTLNVRRVIRYDAPKNDLGVTEIFEVWGWTDKSKSYPFVVVFPNKPPGLPVGPSVEAEIQFAGFFLKNMAYTAFDKRLAAPLLVGKAELVGGGAAAARSTRGAPRGSGLWPIAGVLMVAGVSVVTYRRWVSRTHQSRFAEGKRPEALPEHVNFHISETAGPPSESTTFDFHLPSQ